jgi:hypothetical protein
MARGTSRAQSEVGTGNRTLNYEGRLRKAEQELERADRPGYNATEQIAKVQEILRAGYGRDEKYNIEISQSLSKGGKLNMIDGTIDGKELAPNLGAFSRTNVKSRASDESESDFQYEAKRANEQQGFIFAKDEKGEIFALPHTWNVNRPAKTVGVFAGDTINFLGSADGTKKARTLEVIGTFDNTKRGLNLAAAACGDSIGRTGGIKQTATILTTNPNETFTNQNFSRKVSVIPPYVRDELNSAGEGSSPNPSGDGFNIKRKG